MFDHISPTVFWPLFLLFWGVLGLLCAYVLGRIVDASNPFTHTRRNVDGRKAMATDWRRPTYLPKDWQ